MIGSYDVAHRSEDVGSERLWRHPADGHRSFTVTQAVVVLHDQLARQTEVGHFHQTTLVHPVSSHVTAQQTATALLLGLNL